MTHKSGSVRQIEEKENFKTSLSFSSEYKLLLTGCRPNISKTAVARIQGLLKGAIDWDLMLELLEKHALLPTFFINLKAAGRENVPDEVIAKLQEKYLQFVDSQSRKVDELLRLNSLFEEHCIPVIPFKGPVLSQLYYGDVFLRESADIDLMVPPEKALQAQKILLAEGYAYGHEEMHLVEDASFLASEYSLRFINQFPFEKEIGVDLHWQLFDDGFVNMPAELVIDSAQQREIFGRQVRTLPAEWALLIVSAHSAKHGWFRLNWIVDAAQLLEYIGDDVTNLLRLARKTQTYEMLLLACSLVSQLPEAKVTEELTSEFSKRKNIQVATARLTAQIFEQRNAEKWKLLDWWLFYLSLKETFWQKILLAFNLATHIDLHDWARWKLPPILFCLYKPLHFLRLAWISVPHLAQRLRRTR
ncbi:MAG: hypothetical protein C5B53_01570 [Candidatus Melainabacteria bacterium]|nr:MAG: hypothetical protein C5B53_01570 [Candidatus Melainabacteria bacterium]